MESSHDVFRENQSRFVKSREPGINSKPISYLGHVCGINRYALSNYFPDLPFSFFFISSLLEATFWDVHPVSVPQPITIVFFNLSNATQSNSCRSLNKQKCNKWFQGFFKGPWMLRLLFYIVINVTNVSKATNLQYFSLRVFSTCHCHCQCLFSLWSNISKVTSF